MTEEQWLKEDIEELHECPLCKYKQSSILFDSLVDMMTEASTYKWRLNKCSACEVAYLSPRPNEKKIYKAYADYYTHGYGSSILKKGKASNFLNDLKNIFYNVKYKEKKQSKELIIYSLILIAYPVKLFLDAKIRHIGSLDDKRKKLLDVGCGNGDYLVFARNLGWDTMGLDVDKGAVNAALSKGLNIKLGELESLNKEDMFDMITLNHVIEHVYNPEQLIRQCYEHLNPGGRLWLETPNINSIGLDIYKEYWRGLEPPRHLVLYNVKALSKLLRDAGFCAINQKTHGLAGVYMGVQSEKNIDKLVCHHYFYNRVLRYPKIFFIEMVQLLFRRKSEFITLTAHK